MHTHQPLLLLMFIFCLSPLSSTSEYIDSPLTVKDLHRRLTTYGADVCTRSDPATKVDLLVVVNSTADHAADRHRSRMTWLDRWVTRDVYRTVRVVFFVDEPKDLKQMVSLSSENALYHDVVWANVKEAASDSTVKMASWLNWVMNWCPSAKFVLKVDEYEIVNLPAVFEFVKRNENADNTIWGTVIRDGLLKWFGKFFSLNQPRYCSEEAYLMTGDVVKKLYIGGFKQVPYNKKEHIYYTGFVAKNERINVINNDNFEEMKIPFKYLNTIVEANHAFSSEKCKSIKSNIIFSTADDKTKWIVHWKYLLWALQKCNVMEMQNYSY